MYCSVLPTKQQEQKKTKLNKHMWCVLRFGLILLTANENVGNVGNVGNVVNVDVNVANVGQA